MTTPVDGESSVCFGAPLLAEDHGEHDAEQIQGNHRSGDQRSA